MWSKDRHLKIISLLEARHQVSTDLLAEEFEVSRETVRRDLLELESEGLVKRVHGGAVLPYPVPEEPFQIRMNRFLREKKAIAKCAANLIEPGQCLLVNAGTTTSVFARELARIPDIMVVTNSIDIATSIRHQDGDNVEVLLLGGRIVSDVPGTFGELTLSEISRFQADIAVLSPVALHFETGAADFALHEAEISRAMIAQSGKTMFLADHSKLGTTSRIQYCKPDQINVIVTDAGALKEQIDLFEKNGVGEIIQAS